MTRLGITETSLQTLVDSLRALHQKPRNRALPDPTLLAWIERSSLRAVRRDQTGSTQRDGYPTSTLGGTHTRSNGSSVEAHALAPPIRDRHHELTALVVTQLAQMVHAGNIIVSALSSIDDLTNDQGPAPRTCHACTGHRPLGGDQPVSHRGTVGNRLERETDLCALCYEYVVQSAPPGSHDGRLPTPTHIAWHDQRGRWRLRITG